MSRTTLSICMALLVLTPSLLSAQERSQSFYNKYSDVLYNECWCFDSLIVVPDSTVYIDKSVYEKVIAFWNEQDLGIVLVLAETFVPEQRDYVVLIKRTEDDSRQADRCARRHLCIYAQFHKGPKTKRIDRYGGYCHMSNSILVHDRLYNESSDDIAEVITHELVLH